MLEKAKIAAEALAQGMKKSYVWPLWGIITTEFGGCTFGQCPHIGIDIAEDFLQPIVAANDGVVLFSGLIVPGNPAASYGMTVIIAHSRTEETLYAHLDNLTAPPVVKAGDYVLRGQVIGYVGSTGLATGPHVCFRVRKDGRYVNPLTLDAPAAAEVSKSDRVAFQATMDDLLGALESQRLASAPGDKAL